jgi:hypothetical protein
MCEYPLTYCLRVLLFPQFAGSISQQMVSDQWGRKCLCAESLRSLCPHIEIQGRSMQSVEEEFSRTFLKELRVDPWRAKEESMENGKNDECKVWGGEI